MRFGSVANGCGASSDHWLFSVHVQYPSLSAGSAAARHASRAMWQDAQTRAALLAAAAAGQPDGTREQAIWALANLTNAASNWAPMWEDAQLRGVLLAAAAAGQPDGTREDAIWALDNLAGAASNRVPMWEDVLVRGVLLAAAAAGQPDGTREQAVCTLANLAGAASNRVPMWEDVLVRVVCCWRLRRLASPMKHGSRRSVLSPTSRMRPATGR
jgi:hypothetical protein